MKSSLVILIVTVCALLSAVAQLLFKLASRTFSFNPASWLNVFLIAGLVLYAVVFFIFVWTLRHGDVSVLYPIMASSYIFVYLLALFFLHESITLARVVGVCLIVAGICAITQVKK